MRETDLINFMSLANDRDISVNIKVEHVRDKVTELC